VYRSAGEATISCRATSSCSGAYTSRGAPQSSIMYVSSLAVSRQFSGTKIAPIAVAANSVSYRQGWLAPR